MRRFIIPPVFADAEKTRMAGLLYGIIWPVLLLTTGVLLFAELFEPVNLVRWTYFVSIGIIACLMLLMLTRAGHIRLASWIAVIIFWGIVTSSVITAGGIQAPAILAFPIVILIAGLLLGSRVAIFMAALSSLVTLGMVYADYAGYMPLNGISHTPLTVWFTLTLFVLIVVFLQSLAGRTIREALQQTRESEALYRLLFQSGNDAVFVYGLRPDGRPTAFTQVNDVACQRLGYTREELLTLSPEKIDAPGMETQQAESIRTLRKEGKVLFEQEHLARDGRRIPVEINARLLTLDGQPAVLSIARDITGRKQDEEALREHEQRYREIFDNTSDGIFLVDVLPNGRFRYAGFNPAERRMTGLPDALDGRTTDETLPREIADEINAHYRVCVETGEPIHYEQRLSFPAGVVHTLTTLIPVRDAAGIIYRLVGIGRDITESKLAEQSLRNAKEHTDNLIATANAMVVILDQKGNVQVLNQAAEKITGYTLAELKGRNWFEAIVPRERYPEVWSEFERFFAGGLPTNFENPILTKSGEERYIVWQNSPLREQDKVAGTISFGLDITERRQRERELENIASLSAALRTAPTRTEMMPVIVHQVATLMNVDNVSLEIIDPASGEAIVEQGYGKWAQAIGLHLPLGGLPHSLLLPTGKSYLRNDGSSPQELYRPDLMGDCRAVAGVPMISQDKTIGAIWVGRKAPIENQEMRLLEAVADIAANAIRRTTFFEQIQRDMQRLAALHEIDSAISGTMDLHVVLAVLMSQIVSQLNVDAADVVLFDPVSRILQYSAVQGFRGRSLDQTRLRKGGSLTERVVLERRAIHIADLKELEDSPEARWMVGGEGFVTYHAVPLFAKGQLQGVLEVFHRTSFVPEPEWLGFLDTLAEQAAIAIDNARLFSDLQRANSELYLAYDETIEGWSRALDLRDRETEGHTLRVTELTMRLAFDMKIPDAELAHLRRGALLHDIGKMGVPDSILLKPGKLTEREWVEMRRHPIYAYQLLSPVRYLQPALDIPYCHHEKWDGSGYPRGLKGDRIPLAARLFAVVDVWDALTSDRPYRKAWSKERARDHIRDSSGTHFDPQVVERFLGLIPATEFNPQTIRQLEKMDRR